MLSYDFINQINRIESLLGPNGEHWYQGGGEDPDNRQRMCLVRVASATTDQHCFTSSLSDILGVMLNVINEQFPDRAPNASKAFQTFGDVVSFNDHPETTFADIQLVLEKTKTHV